MSQKILSIYLQIPRNFNFSKLNYLQWQGWDGCNLLVFGESEDIYKFKQKIGDRLAEGVVDYRPNRGINDVLDGLQSEYLTWLNPFELWNKDFLLHTKEFLSDCKHQASEVVYAVGFVRKNQETVFAAEVYPQLGGENAIYKNFLKPLFLSPSVKYFWRSDVIKSFGLKFEEGVNEQLLREGLLTVDYFASVYRQRNYTNPDFSMGTLGFLTGELDEGVGLQQYRQRFLKHKSTWEKNPWQLSYWQSKRLSRILKKLTK